MVGSLVNVKVDGKADTALATHYGIAGYPTVILAHSDGTEIDRVYGYEEPETFVVSITDYLADRNTLADYLRKADTAATMQIYNVIAGKYTSRKQFTDAESYYRKILQNDPTNKLGYSDSALYNMGEMKIRAKQFTAALETYDRLRATYPESDLFDDALYQKGYVLRRAEKFDEAIAQFQDFLTVHPDSDLKEDAVIYVAYCNELKGDNDEALKYYRKFLEDFPESSEIKWVTGQIDTIENPPKEDESN